MSEIGTDVPVLPPMSVAGEMKYRGGYTIPDWALHWVHRVWNLFRHDGDGSQKPRSPPRTRSGSGSSRSLVNGFDLAEDALTTRDRFRPAASGAGGESG